MQSHADHRCAAREQPGHRLEIVATADEHGRALAAADDRNCCLHVGRALEGDEDDLCCVSSRQIVHQGGDVTRDPLEQLERAIRAQIDYIIQNKVPFGLFLHEFDSLSGKRQHKLISVMSRYNSRFVELVRRGQERGQLMEGEPWIIVNGILGMCNWLYRWYDTDHVSDPEQVKQIFLKMILDGIRRR